MLNVLLRVKIPIFKHENGIQMRKKSAYEIPSQFDYYLQNKDERFKKTERCLKI